MSAIRIIRSALTTPPDMEVIERDELVHEIAQRFAEASGSPERLDECARRLQESNLSEDDTEELIQAIDQGLQTSNAPMDVHSELDLQRIFSLLED